MHQKWKLALKVTGYAAAAGLLIGAVQYSFWKPAGNRVWHHELAAEANTDLGLSEIPEDDLVGEDFVTHLPLVIIDTGGTEIPNYKVYDSETDSFVVQEGKEPYVTCQIEIIDNASLVNTLTDAPSHVTWGRIKIRGNSSSSSRFPKKQYSLKLETAEGEKNPLGLMGMPEADTWILNGTQLDESYLRNYIAMNTGGILEPYTPDLRYCEVLFRTGDDYEYRGLYVLYEKIEQGVGRVEIPEVSNPPAGSDRSYLLLRDRKDQSSYNLSVYSTEHQRSNNWISLEYPSVNNITPEYWSYIQNDIRDIEGVLYSDSYKEFIRYRELLDVDSFLHYWIINEFFSNYDSGWNSTYLYKKADGKIAIGPFWDFDNGMDNFGDSLLAMDCMVMQEAPWFDRLVTDDWFVEQLVDKYRSLRQDILSEEVLEQRIEEAKAFLRKPVQRDISRWGALYKETLGVLEEADTELTVDRNTDSWEAETQRIMDVMRAHGDYLDQNITDLYSYVVMHNSQLTNTAVGVAFILVFFAAVILVQKLRKGE